ncbi:MAG TPA: hypothetical protein VFW07_25200 [Parafilimonas sp.]|nr:hypothetical protein [Parafilimonas sp.]
MKPILLSLSLVCLLLSCTKSNDASENDITPPTENPSKSDDSTVAALKAHVWLFDSLLRIENGEVTDSIIQSNPKIEMWYTNDNLYFNFPDGPQSEYNYEVVEGNKLYRWREGNPKDEYFIIQRLTDKLLVLSTHDEPYQDYEYYSPK